MIATRVIDDDAAFGELRHEWNDLLQDSSCCCLFLTWEWLHTWWQFLAADRKLHIITVRRDGLLIAIAPLAIRSAFTRPLMPLKVLEFLGSGNAGSDYLSFLIRSGHEDVSLKEITRSLSESGLMLELTRVEKTSLAMANVAGRLKESGWKAYYLTTNFSPHINLSGHTWQSYRRSLNSTHLKMFERKEKKLYRDFEVKLERASSEDECRAAMDVYMDLHLERWSEDGGSTAIGEQDLVRFHRAFSSLSLNRGWLRLFTLTLDGDPVASLYLFQFNKVYYYYQTAFDLEYGKYSVGMIILSLAIKAAIEDEAVEFDFLHDDEEYKYLWSHGERELIRLEICPSMHPGSIYQKAVSAKHRLVRAARRYVPR
jgi:CelD/BcsL family acetyltransferase involved in cellulose biosynthesis